MKRDILNNDTLEIKSTNFVNKDTLNDPTKNKYAFIERVFQKIITPYDCFVSAVIIQNEDVEKYFSRDKLSKHYIYLLQRIQEAAEKQNRDVVVVIDNDNRRIDKSVAYSFNNYLYKTTDGQRLDRILEVPIFADSEMTIGIQLADIVAGVIRKYYQEGLNERSVSDQDPLYLQKLIQYYGNIQKASQKSWIYKAPSGFLSKYYRLK